MTEREYAPWQRTPALVLLVGYWAALVVGTHWPRPPHLMGLGASDKTLHLAAYFGLALLVCFNWALWRSATRRHVIAIVALLIAFGAVDEVTQIPFGREAQFLDWVADFIGVLGGVAVFAAANAWFRRSGREPHRA
jgi:VanZ family protein